MRICTDIFDLFTCVILPLLQLHYSCTFAGSTNQWAFGASLQSTVAVNEVSHVLCLSQRGCGHWQGLNIYIWKDRFTWGLASSWEPAVQSQSVTVMSVTCSFPFICTASSAWPSLPADMHMLWISENAAKWAGWKNTIERKSKKCYTPGCLFLFTNT